MDTKNLGLTLFDILSYLLPGLVLLTCFSLIEATYIHTSFLDISKLTTNGVITTLLAYFLGHVCYSLASYSKNFFYNLFKKPKNNENKNHFKKLLNRIRYWIYKIAFGNQDNGLSDSLYQVAKNAIIDTFHLDSEEIGKTTTMERFLLADSYVLASGGGDERMSLLVREGFYKSATVAFALLSVTFISSLFIGGISVQIEGGKFQMIGFDFSLGITIFLIFITVMFGDRYKFFNRMKMNNTYILFLAYREKNSLKN